MTTMLTLALLIPTPRALGTAPSIRYAIDAHLDAGLRHLEGTIRARVRVPARCDRLLILNYPAQANIPPDATDDIEGPRIYPGRFEPAILDMSFSQDGRPLTVETVPPPSGWRADSLMVVHLDRPAGPEETLEVRGNFHLRIPKRFGLFGRIGHQMTLNGGWYPQILAIGNGEKWHTVDPDTSQGSAPESAAYSPCRMPPPRADVTLRLEVPPGTHVLVDGQWLEPASGDTRVHLAETQFPALAVGALEPRSMPVPLPVRLFDSRDTRREHRQIAETVSAGLAIWTSTGLPSPASDVVIVRAPLRRSLVEVGERTLWLSDMAFRADPITRRFHRYALLHGLFQLWLEPLIADLEPGIRSRWLADGLAWVLVDRYRASVTLGALELSGAVARLSFLPEFDEILNAPRFAFSQELYNKAYREDRFHENIFDLTGPAVSGRVLMMKLEDCFGAAAVRRAARALFSGTPEPLETLLVRSVIEQKDTRDDPEPGHGPGHRKAANHPGAETTAQVRAHLETLFARLCTPRPRIDCGLHRVETTREGAGFVTRIDVGCHDLEGNPATPLCPVAVAIETRDGTQRTVWAASARPITAASDGGASLRVTTSSRPRRVVLDPDHRLEEQGDDGVVLRGDNTVPRRHKVMFAVVPGAWDPNTWRFQGAVSLYLTTPYQRRWLWWASAYTSQQVLGGATMGGSYFFGPYRNALWRRHQVSASIQASRRGVWTPESGVDTDSVQDLAGLRISYRYDSRISYRHPVRGVTTYAGVEGGWEATAASSAPYGIFTISGAKPWSWHPRFALVARLRADASAGLRGLVRDSGMGLLPLGGPYAVRGLASDALYGTQRWLASLEHRWMVARNAVPYALGIHFSDVQIVEFVDAGAVGDDLSALGKPACAVGAGVRLFFDVMAVGEARLGVDVATMVAGGSGWQAYMRFGQPF